MHNIPGAVDIEELKKLARENGGVVKYYIASSRKTTHRFLNDAGKFSWDEDGPWHFANPDYPRFTNYWYAYAYKLRLTEEEVTTI